VISINLAKGELISPPACVVSLLLQLLSRQLLRAPTALHGCPAELAQKMLSVEPEKDSLRKQCSRYKGKAAPSPTPALRGRAFLVPH